MDRARERPTAFKLNYYNFKFRDGQLDQIDQIRFQRLSTKVIKAVLTQ